VSGFHGFWVSGFRVSGFHLNRGRDRYRYRDRNRDRYRDRLLNLKRAVELSTLFGFWVSWFLGFRVSWFHGFIQIGVGIAIGIDCFTTGHKNTRKVMAWFHATRAA
ncbi:MAG TPA: hypothetical protein PLJ32_08620, partial [Kiritimatiellia bacterium]|nr:hypothetical protein [Kiritimatiellia bacterium]